MTELPTATVASAAERIAASSYFWGQTSTGPSVERRFAATDFLTKDASGNVGLGIAPSYRWHVQGGDTSVALYAGVTRAVRFAFSSTEATIAGTDQTGSGSYEQLGIGGGSIIFRIGVTQKATLDANGNFLVISSAGLGYGTGAGGTVTQATSRTTAVTLNKPCGAITLVSAAGSTSWQSFTVNNSLVAATDTIMVNQKSGTDKYMIHVTAVAAGSFQIRFATMSGTTTEQPVFNFAICKAVTS